MSKLLIVEDEQAILDLIRMSLCANGYECDSATDGEAGADLICERHYDLLLLDIMLPKLNGYELLEYAQKENIPVIFITAKGELQDRVKGLNMGADDYIVKPFEIDELIARIRSVLRRYKNKIHLPNIEIDTKQRKVMMNEREIHLTLKEYDLLLYLVENGGNTLTRGQLAAAVWEKDFENTRTIDLHIQRLRKKLCLENVIQTVPKIGYRFEV